MSNLKEAVEAYIKRVKDLADHVRGNEQATKQSLIGPFFTLLGYDLTDPRECIPEHKTDFGKERSNKPIDWAFLHNGGFAFFVEAKEVGKKLTGYYEQLADYFAKETSAKLGILTNGAQWRFFTDVVNPNVMDREPFAKWDVFNDDTPPYDVITLLQKATFNSELIRALAQRQRAQNLLVGELERLLEPSSEFAKLAIQNLETRNLTQAVVESWKPMVGGALNEWARQRMLTAALSPAPSPVTESKAEGKSEAGKIITTPEELESFEIIKNLLGPDRPIAYEDSVAYFKVHLAERRTWVFIRLYLDKKIPCVWVPLSPERTAELVGGRPIDPQLGWTQINLKNHVQIAELGDVIRAAYDAVREEKLGKPGQKLPESSVDPEA